MESEGSLSRTADELEQGVVAAFGRNDGPEASPDALASLLRYVALLREASGAAARYSFKLQLDDGRWDVAEEELPAVPRVGDVVRVSRSQWRVVSTQLVHRRPPGKPPCEFYVCAPAA